MTTGDDKFDQIAKQHYDAATESLSPTLQGRLRAARRTALAGEPSGFASRPLFGLPIAAMTAAVFALAIGVRMKGEIPATPTSQQDDPIAMIDANDDNASDEESLDEDASLRMLDDDPDFYLWLDSDESAALELEH